jgi:MFS transporter, ACS family, tartrate transporter
MSLPTQENERRVLKQVVRRLVPFIFLCYVIAYIDRVNIGFAASSMQRDLGMSNTVYGIGGGLFFFGYFLFEIPSNLLLERVGARIWIARIMVVWGLVSMAMMFVVGKWSFYGLRVLLGLAEAGFFPGMILYLTYWIPARERAKTGALFMLGIPAAMLIGAPISEALLSLDGVGGLQGWQWLFLVEGLPAVILGIVALFYLTDRPEKAHWLSAPDREWLSKEMARERADSAARRHVSFAAALKDPKMLVLCLFYFLNNTATYGVFLFLPKILREASGYSGWKLIGLNTPIFAVAMVGMVLIGRHSDRTGERKKHVAVCALLAAAGLMLAAAFQRSVPLIVLSFILSQLGQRSLLGPFWAIPPIFLGGTAAAAGIALINSVGNLGGQVGPTVMGWLRDGSQGYAGGLLVLAGGLVLEALVILSLKLPARQETTTGRPIAAAAAADRAATNA